MDNANFRPKPKLENLSLKIDENHRHQDAVFSPITSLALNLGQLHTESVGTPKKRLSLSSNGSESPTPSRRPFSKLFDLGQSFEYTSSPSFDISYSSGLEPVHDAKEDCLPFGLQSRILASRSCEKRRNSFNGNRKRSNPSLRRIKTHGTLSYLSPMSLLEDNQRQFNNLQPCDQFSPKQKLRLGDSFCVDEDSRDSGIGSDNHKDDEFHFTEPVGLPPRRMRILNEDTCSPKQYSPVKSKRSNSLPPTSLFSHLSSSKPCTFERQKSKETSVLEDDDDDLAFFDEMEFDDDDKENQGHEVKGLKNLLHAPMVLQDRTNQMEVDSPSPKPRRGLFKSPSAPKLNTENGSVDICCRPHSYKRSPPPPSPRDDTTPVLLKRRKSVLDHNDYTNFSPIKLSAKFEGSSLSDSEESIKSALNKEDSIPNLVGDFSRSLCLPTVTGKKADLKSISCDTMSKVLRGEYDHAIEKLFIIDCRYPYEYEGGHIKGGENWYTHDSIMENFFKKVQISTDINKRCVLIFHCEFSSERGPKMCRFLRKQDREANQDCYPHLHYPELYLLEGGYKDFYALHKDLCTPESYKPMLHEDHQEDYRKFKIKAKSWAGEKGHKGRPGLRTLKFC